MNFDAIEACLFGVLGRPLVVFNYQCNFIRRQCMGRFVRLLTKRRIDAIAIDLDCRGRNGQVAVVKAAV